MKQFKKILIITIFILLLLFTRTFIFAEEISFYSIKASVGENATSVGINYHTNTENSKLYLAKSATMANATEYTPTQILWGKGTTSGDPKSSFANRYVCSVNITGLDINTDYYYQIRDGSAESKINHFKTPKSEKTTFAVFCDTQASGSNFQYSDQLAQKLTSINQDISFFMIAGDIVDRGGYEEQWNNFDTYMPYLNGEFLQATIPGNHELYHSSQATYVDESIYNKYYNNPKNGTAERPNSTYYFKYNNVLFIMLDTMQRSNSQNLYDEQIAWFKDVVMNNPADFTIVVTHPGCYSAGAYASDASIMRSKWSTVFEQYGVDLAISGHEHVYLRTKKLYQEKVDEDRGLTYVIGGCAGAKRYTGKNNPDLFEVYLESTNPMGTYTGSIVEIVNNKLTMSYYGSDGELLDQFELTSKKIVDPDYTIDEFMDSFSVYYNNKTRRNILTWDKRGYGKIKEMDVYLTHLDVTLNTYVGPSSNELAIGMGTPNKDYHYEITLKDYDGNVYYKTIDVINDQVALRPSDFKLDIKESEQYVYELTFTYNNKNLSEIALDLIYKGKDYTFSEGILTLRLNEALDLNELNIELLYDFYGEGSLAEISIEDMTVTTDLIIDEVEPIDPEPVDDTPKTSSCFGANGIFISLFSFMSIISLGYYLFKKH